jgi:MYXO-CTERM domain-containing protein
MKKCLLMLSCWSALLPLGHASPITLFDTIDGVTSAGTLLNYQAGYFSMVASSFSTVNSPFVLKNVALELGPGANDAGILDIYLYSDTGSIAPNLSTAISLGSISDSTLFTDGVGVYNFAADISLQAHTLYWIGVNDLGNEAVPSTSKWGYVTTLAGTIGAAGEYNYDPYDGTYGNTTVLYGVAANQMTVTGDDVPEPATSLLGALGLGALAFLRRRRSAV